MRYLIVQSEFVIQQLEKLAAPRPRPLLQLPPPHQVRPWQRSLLSPDHCDCLQPGAARARALGDEAQRAGAGHRGLAAGEGGGVRAGVRGPRLHPAQHPLHLQPLPPAPRRGGHHAGPLVPA